MPSKDKYTDPKLRDEVKEELHKSDKGGAPGQWSARKAQMMASEYKKRGGDYNTDKSEKDESQKNLSKWGEEDWQTKEGSGNAKKEDGTQKRYLPKKAWENMTEEEKQETDNKKQEQSKQGKQHVENTDKAKQSRRKASKNDDGEKQAKRHDSTQDEEEEDENDKENEGGEQEQHDDKENEDDTAKQAEAEEDEEEEDHDDEEDEQNGTKSKAGQKRGRSQSKDSNKKQKSNSGEAKSKNGKETVGSKHMDAKEPGKKGSADRLPKKDQKVSWKAMPGYVEGKVVEILKKGKQVDGKSVKASEKDPKLVLKSDSSGKICVHKPDACFYD